MHGATAEDTILEVPVGTIVTDKETGEVIVDLLSSGQEHILCHGWRGWFGNAHFPSSTRQAPNFAELGDVGEERDVKLELKLVADVWLVWLPNAGKSTVIQSITNVKPKIADYAFTTLIPNLGVMEHKWRSLVIEDVPGLIEGASDGKWLGTQFLKHIDRCHIIIHLIDASQWEEAMLEAYRVIRGELEKWSEAMAEKKEIIIFSKADIIDPEMLEEMVGNFEKSTGKKVALTISAGAYIRIDTLKDLLIESIPERKKDETLITEDDEWYIQEITEWDDSNESWTHVYDLKRVADPKRFTITRIDESNFEVKWERIEEIVRMTNMQYTEWVNRVYNVMEKLGIIRKIKSTLVSELASGSNNGFFEGEEDKEVHAVWIAWRKFSLENVLFMKGDRE